MKTLTGTEKNDEYKEIYDLGIRMKEYTDLNTAIMSETEIDWNWIFSDNTLNQFFDAGYLGHEYPVYTYGWRYGEAINNNRSTDYTDNRYEAGLSMMWVDGEDENKSLSSLFIAGEKHYYRGYKISKRGSDGEALLIGTTKI